MGVDFHFITSAVGSAEKRVTCITDHQLLSAQAVVGLLGNPNNQERKEMSQRKIVVLDGAGSNDQDLAPILGVLSQVLEVSGAVQVFPLRETKLAYCLGCFNCWIKTPGMCVEADAGREIAKAVIRSDVTVFFTPVTFGGYSPELKKGVRPVRPAHLPLLWSGQCLRRCDPGVQSTRHQRYCWRLPTNVLRAG